jgi:uncharacterized protein YndB with AHSA1/START domain
MTAQPVRSPVQVVTASHDIAAGPDKAFAAVLSADGLRHWFRGVSTVDTSDTWPEPDARMIWTVPLAGRFTATVVQYAPPRSIVLDVETPTARSRITHAFEPLPGGGTRYTKTVAAYYLPAKRWLRSVLAAVLPSEVRRETQRAAQYADGVKPPRGTLRTGVMLALLALAWLGFAAHNLADLPGQTLLSPETSLPTLVYAALVAGWFTPARRTAAWLLLGWTLMHLLGGGVISVLPLPILPFEPEQSLYHYTFHLLYTLTQVPLTVALARFLLQRHGSATGR